MKRISFALICALVIIASCSKKSAPVGSLSPADIYKDNCARCHGATGVEGRAPNLAQLKIDRATILNIITHGKDHMPAFESRLSAADIDAVTTFVVALKK